MRILACWPAGFLLSPMDKEPGLLYNEQRRHDEYTFSFPIGGMPVERNVIVREPVMKSPCIGRDETEKWVVYLLYAAVFVLPLSALAFDACLGLTLILALWRSWKHKRWELHAGPFWKPAAGCLIFSFASVFVSPSIPFSFYNWLLLPGAYMALYVLIFTYLKTDKDKENALYAFLAGALAVGMYGFWQFLNIEHMAASIAAMDWVDPERFPLLYRRMYSTLGNPNLLSVYLLMIMALLSAFGFMEKEKRRKWFFSLCFFFFLICLILTYSRSAWVSLFFMAAFLSVVYDRRIAWVFVLVPLVLLVYHGQVTERFLSLFSGGDTSTSLRFALWESTEAMIEEHPFFGVGWGAYYLAYPDYNFFIQDPHVLIYHAHNMYLSVPAEIGLPGAFCFFWLILCHGYKAWTMYKRGKNSFVRAMGLGTASMLIAVAVSGMGDYALFSRMVSLCFWCILAMTASAGKEEVKELQINS